jgi:hypothetical protein
MLNKGIVVIPTHGFCNRLRMIASTKIYCDLNKIPFFICWIPTTDCNINIRDFLLTDNIQLLDFDEITKSNTLYFGKVHTQSILDTIKNTIESKIKIYNYLVIEGGHEFRDTSMSSLEFIYKKHIFYNSLNFTKSIINKVDKILENIDLDNTIGIHYRDIVPVHDSNDINKNKNLDFVKNSPIELFIEILLNTKCNNLIVISNSKDCYNMIKNNIKNKHIITTESENYDRNSKDGMISSIVDLLVLSKTKMIIGSYYSSFSDEAAFFNYIPKLMPLNSEYITKNDRLISIYHCHGFSFSDFPIINENNKILFEIFGNNIRQIEDLY